MAPTHQCGSRVGVCRCPRDAYLSPHDLGCDSPHRVFAHSDILKYGESAALTASGRRALDIAAWLRGLELEQYEAAFHANEIDASVLPRLTAVETGRKPR